MKMRSVTPIRIAKIGYIVMSVVFCIVGVMFMAWSDISTVVLGRALGITMIIFGVVKMVGYFSKDLFRLAFQYDLELGTILTVLGVMILIRPAGAMSIVAVTIGIIVLADALFKIRIASDSKKFGIRPWWVILALAIVTGIIGLTLIFRPWTSAKILTVLLGISLLSEGILNLCVVITTVKIVKNQYPDVIEADFSEVEGDAK